MKLHIVLVSFLIACMASLRAQTPLDTIFFDDFEDNRKNWKLYSSEEASLQIADGFMLHTRLKGKGTYNLQYAEALLESPDTFLYEIKIVSDSARMCGAAFKLHRTKRETLCCYTGIGMRDNGRMDMYHYSRRDNWMKSFLVAQIPNLKQKEMTYRVTAGKDLVHVHVNGHHLKSYRRTKYDVLKEWGWVFRGLGTIQVDYMLLMAG